jgi:hypothetical protein
LPESAKLEIFIPNGLAYQEGIANGKKCVEPGPVDRHCVYNGEFLAVTSFLEQNVAKNVKQNLKFFYLKFPNTIIAQKFKFDILYKDKNDIQMNLTLSLTYDMPQIENCLVLESKNVKNCKACDPTHTVTIEGTCILTVAEDTDDDGTVKDGSTSTAAAGSTGIGGLSATDRSSATNSMHYQFFTFWINYKDKFMHVGFVTTMVIFIAGLGILVSGKCTYSKNRGHDRLFDIRCYLTFGYSVIFMIDLLLNILYIVWEPSEQIYYASDFELTKTSVWNLNFTNLPKQKETNA